VQAQHDITEDEAEDQGAQEVVAKELHIGGVCKKGILVNLKDYDLVCWVIY